MLKYSIMLSFSLMCLDTVCLYFKSEHHNMVWEVKTNQMPNAVQKLLLVMDKRASGMNDSLELLQCNENLPSSPGYNSCEEHMELGKQNQTYLRI